MPRIPTTRTVKIALYLLRIYLVAMLGLILVRFIMDLSNHHSRAEGPPPTSRPAVEGTHPTPHDP